MSVARTAVVTVVHGRHEHLARQRASLARSTTSYEHVVVAVDDPEVAGSSVTVPPHPLGLPVATARNRGAAHALERGATTLVFLDVDCLAAPTSSNPHPSIGRTPRTGRPPASSSASSMRNSGRNRTKGRCTGSVRN